MLKMVPIGKDTKLCAVLGRNAFESKELAYLNAIFVAQKRDIAAIALNVAAEHFALTLTSLTTSKVQKILVLDEYAQACIAYCNTLDADATRFGRVHVLEVEKGKLHGANLHSQTLPLLNTLDIEPSDDQSAKIAQCSVCTQRWFQTTPLDGQTLKEITQGATHDQH